MNRLKLKSEQRVSAQLVIVWGRFLPFRSKLKRKEESDLTPLDESRFCVSILEFGERKEVRMARKRFTPEQIVGMLREAEVRLFQGEKVEGICRGLGITEQTYYR